MLHDLLRLVALGLVFIFSPCMVYADTVSIYLDQSNIAAPTSLGDGINYLKVTIDDEGVVGDINFTVEVLSPLSSLADSSTNFGIQKFGFNSKMGTSGITAANFVAIPDGWSLDAPPGTINNDGFGAFEMVLSDGGSNRLSSFRFSITGISGDTIDTYREGSFKSNGDIPSEGSVFYVAHVAGFTDPSGTATSGYFGGLTLVPLPAGFVLLFSALVSLTTFRKRFIN